MSIWLDQMVGEVWGIFSTLGGLIASPPVQEKHIVLSLGDMVMWKLPLIGLPLISLTAPLFWIMGYCRLKKSER